MKVFATLLRREWMQHQRGWLIALAVPFVVLLLAVVFGQMHLGDDGEALNQPVPAFAAIVAVSVIGTLGLVVLSVLFQAAGLARRDQQDRSIEFWLSLPTPPSQSVAATLLAHLWLLPIAAIGVGLAGGFVLGLLTVIRVFGPAALLDLPWGTLVVGAVAVAARLTLGVLLASAWLSPMILMGMAASAWLKRWGVPVVVASVVFGHLLLERMFSSQLIGHTVQTWFEMSQRAFFMADRGASLRELEAQSTFSPPDMLWLAVQWLGGDAWRGVATLASPYFVVALAFGGLGYALLVYSRRWGR